MIYITFKGIEYQIPYDRDTLKINKTIDSTFDSGYFETSPLTDLGLLDVSRRIPRNLLVRIVYDEQTFYFKTGETYKQQLNFGSVIQYKHMINLVSLAKDLTRKPLENMTVTQPKGDFGQYSRSVNRAEDMELTDEVTLVTPTYTNLVNSNLTKIDGLEIIALDEYTVVLDTTISYVPFLLNRTISMRIKYDGVTIFTDSILIPSEFSFKTKRIRKTISYKYTPTALGEFSVEYEWTIVPDVVIHIDISDFSITGLEVVSQPIRTYSQVIDKMLSRSEYVLSAQSRSRLNLTANEDKYEEYTLYDALSKIGGYMGALVRVGGLITERYWKIRGATTEDFTGDSINDFSPYEYDLLTVIKIGTRYYENVEGMRQLREIYFDFFDNPETFEPIGFYDKSEQAELEDYVSAVELNTKNVLKPIRYSPFRGGWKSLRSLAGIGQFTTDNIGYETEDNIERPIQVLIKGVTSRNAANTVTYDDTDVEDITERVLEKRQWDTLPSEADYSYVGKQQLLKNNTLYYIKGDNKIYGMSYYGETEGRIIGDADVTRAVYETVYAVRSIAEGELMTLTGTETNNDPGLTGDLALTMQVTYSNQTQSRARVYKDDQTGFDTELVKYLNESANVNESDAIGNYAQLIVNRLGGTKHSVSGEVDSLDDIANLGDIDSNGRVYTIIELWLGKRIKYKYTLVQDYNIISNYIGIQSRHRIEEVSSESATIRTLRYTSKFIFTDTKETFSTRLVRSEDLLGSLLAETSDGLTYGYIEFYLSNGEVKKFHLSVDSDSKGKTIEIKWNMPSNYSAGMKRYSIVKGSDTIWLNLDAPYTDYYGKVNDILFSIYYDNAGTLDTDAYPEATVADGTTLFTVITDTIDKDAGEIIHGLVEIPILSESSKIRVFNGFARWNKIVEGTDRIRACALNYIPVKNASKVDLSRVTDITVSGSTSFGELNLNFTLGSACNGIAFYNIDTLDFLLAYIEEFTSGSKSIKLYYKVEDSRFGGGLNLSAHRTIQYQLTGEIDFTSNNAVEFNENILHETTYELGDDVLVNVDEHYLVTETVTYSFNQGVAFSENILHETVTQLGDDYAVEVTEHYLISPTISVAPKNDFAISENILHETTRDYDLKFTMTFNADGGTVDPLTKEGIFGEPLGTLPTPTKTGYTFVRWVKGFTSVNSSTTYSWKENITLDALYTGAEYTVTFNANGGTTPSPTSKTVVFGSTYGTLATTTRTDYTFLGWFTASSGGTQLTSSTEVTNASNHTLYAQWESNYATSWIATSTTSTSPSVNYSTGDTNCRTESDTKTWLDSNYPATGYLKGTIIRVRVITSESTLCATFYYEAI
jgi:uncharacterized repeat protein (TIGR02543 family)